MGFGATKRLVRKKQEVETALPIFHAHHLASPHILRYIWIYATQRVGTHVSKPIGVHQSSKQEDSLLTSISIVPWIPEVPQDAVEAAPGLCTLRPVKSRLCDLITTPFFHGVPTKGVEF